MSQLLQNLFENTPIFTTFARTVNRGGFMSETVSTGTEKDAKQQGFVAQ
ncbi:MAG: hypothetical protein JKY42_05055, partial [Flavobacteriales bacterium]|nr:hypothetical protein [Flavobacteriales bacterium]